MVEAGRIVCPDCARPVGRKVRLSGSAVALLERVRTRPPAEWQDLDPPAPVRRQCFDAVDSFIRYHLGLTWEGGRFRKT
jgi:DNA repair protein RecO (recombination protein O)